MAYRAGKLKLVGTVLLFLCLIVCCFCPMGILPRPLRSALDPHYISGEVEPLPFNRDLWLAGKARHRVGMAKYLADQKALHGMSRACVIEMLGEPAVDPPGDEGTCWLLGYIAKGMFDEELWLEVTVTPEGVVADAGVHVEWGTPSSR